MSEADNVRVWDGQRAGHYEVWYLTLNHRLSGTGFWIRYTLEAPKNGHGEPYGQLWFAAFDAGDPGKTFAINRKFPIAEMRAGDIPFSISLPGAELRHDMARGQLTGGGHSASWDLSWTPDARTHRHLPEVMYRRGGVGDTTVLSPNLDVAFRGSITVDGRRLELDGEPGCQTHLWGRKHAHAWAWGHCNAFEGRPGAAFESLTVKLKRRGRVLPPMTICALRVDGKEHRFTEFTSVPFSRGGWNTGHYWFRAGAARFRLEGEFTCRPDDMVVAPYVDPDGEPSFCSNTEVGDLRIVLSERGLTGWREIDELYCDRAAHFEIGGRERDPAVVRDHATV
jgi:hypothetical protein